MHRALADHRYSLTYIAMRRAGGDLVFKTHKTKFGRTLAFVDTTILDSCGVPLALARHIKFQPMGVLEYAIMPLLKPFFYTGLESYLSSLAPHSVEEPTSKQVSMNCAVKNGPKDVEQLQHR